uniref:Uncharacterized protein n=1 Tax=Grammatophora oceanica TaxID=210454 RepID=A0A7S1Y6R6_9STRA|mmetsp:Transcript_27432/g.40258  ORF Transcript_27432/g.40258 Transcript_27432/m.40258 type:complete len:187 (+) Transcript_27432:70-630(+)|eukprot:CAMPEP_0194048838 /NCGR_PEP_ID=MMETSP0009_2-20130614/28711_1 /TAXON_ID=210454 /ORGANISM="Grammatophora oceanica, Strain CCMP 410" /LENGTH=186 /DNA_ID=CAMNT_0038694837 /DNA_START=45 /DNA_END=605 /DNA_ORIENTATION=+
MKTFALFLIAAITNLSWSFTVTAPSRALEVRRDVSLAAEGFGKAEEKAPREMSENYKKKIAERDRYDDIAGQGGQEYNIYVRQFGSDDESWFPCGAIAVPRGAQVSDAVFANEESLKKAIVRTYPKLEGFEQEFEFGFNLKVYPDDPIETATKGGARAPGLSFGNWISTLLSPVDNSGVKPPPVEE